VRVRLIHTVSISYSIKHVPCAFMRTNMKFLSRSNTPVSYVLIFFSFFSRAPFKSIQRNSNVSHVQLDFNVPQIFLTFKALTFQCFSRSNPFKSFSRSDPFKCVSHSNPPHSARDLSSTRYHISYFIFSHIQILLIRHEIFFQLRVEFHFAGFNLIRHPISHRRNIFPRPFYSLRFYPLEGRPVAEEPRCFFYILEGRPVAEESEFLRIFLSGGFIHSRGGR
jgi:hypothetical protein